jgi:hypothetical protein
MARLNLGHWSFRFGQREAKGRKRVRKRLTCHLTELSEERKRREHLGAFLEKKRAHEVKGLEEKPLRGRKLP